MSYTQELTSLSSMIRSVNEQMVLYSRLKGTPKETNNELREKLIVEIDNDLEDCTDLYQECNRLFDEIMRKYNYYGKDMCHDIYDKIYSYDDINNNGKTVYLEAIKKLHSNFGIMMQKIIDNIKKFTQLSLN